MSIKPPHTVFIAPPRRTSRSRYNGRMSVGSPARKGPSRSRETITRALRILLIAGVLSIAAMSWGFIIMVFPG